jgi:hypothetical protein
MAMSISEIEKILNRIGLSMEESNKAWRESRAETERVLAESRAETERVMRNLAATQEKTSADLDRWVGRIGNDIGYIVEVVLLPGIRQKMCEFGHNFNKISARHRYYRKDNSCLTEVDVLLENCNETMAVEVKTGLTVSAVQGQLVRLKKLRDNEADTNLVGKTLYSAIAGLHIDEDAREMALNHGMYLIEMYEDKKLISVIKPKTKLGTW